MVHSTAMLHNCCALLPEGSVDLLGNVIRGPVGLQVHHLLRIVVDHLKRGSGKEREGWGRMWKDGEGWGRMGRGDNTMP